MIKLLIKCLALFIIVFNSLVFAEVEKEPSSQIPEVIVEELKSSSVSQIEDSKIYTGYIQCAEKDGEWYEFEPPKVGDIEKLIMSKYSVFSDGTVMLSKNYPFNKKYKILSVKEINSFLEESGYTFHYYEVTFKVAE